MPPLIGTTGAASAKGFGFTASLGAGAFLTMTPINESSLPGGDGPFVALTSGGNVLFQTRGVNSPYTQNNLGMLAPKGTVLSDNYVDLTIGGTTASSDGATYSSSTDTLYYPGSFVNSTFLFGTVSNASTSPAGSSGVRQSASASGFSRFYLYGEGAISAGGIFYQVGVGDYFSGCTQYQRPVVAKGTTSGLSFLRGQTTFNSSAPQYTTPAALRLESSTNLVVCGSIDFNDVYLMKMNLSTGSVGYQRRFNGLTANQPAYMSMDVDTTNNTVYVVSTSNSGTLNLSKFDSSGNNTFYRTVSGGSGSPTATSVKVSGGFVYIYAVWRNDTGSRTQFALFKFDTSGTLQWQRIFYMGNNPMSVQNSDYSTKKVEVGSDGFVYFIANLSSYSGSGGTPAGLIIKYPTSGSITGTYAIPGNDFYIANGSYTVSTGSTVTPTTVSITFGNATLGTAVTGSPTLGAITGRSTFTTPL